ncbi:MAG: quinolinate synthase NadA [Desulfonatronovibrionaceae bacterium]
MYSEQIFRIKQKMGGRLKILAHHYQHDSIVEHADLVGDSLQLASAIPNLEAEKIIFCGVNFMAETAAALAGPGQMVFAPVPEATCVMADMAPARLVETILQRLSSRAKVIPLAYVNSSLQVKDICGRYQGSVCTSANAAGMLDWALSQGDQVLFLPDQNLGQNTADQLEISPDEISVLNIKNNGQMIDPGRLAARKLLLWPGVCAVHYRLKPDTIQKILAADPQALIIVHPETSPQVVSLAHESGSTSKIISFVEKAPPGSRIYIGTEDHLVHRLQKKHKNKHIFSLKVGFCSNMSRTTPQKLLKCLEKPEPQRAVKIQKDLARNARRSIQTMLKAGSS